MNFFYTWKKFLVPGLLLVLLLSLSFYRFSVSPVGNDETANTVDIPTGSSLFRIAEILYDADVIHNRPFFWALVIGKGAARNIKAGEYEFSARLSPSEIIDKLVRGEKKYYNVLIPEDINTREISQRLQFYKLIDEKEFSRLITDREFVRSLGINEKSLEGYLFPDTYRLDRSMTTREIIRMMVNNFHREVNETIRKQARERKMTIHQLLTLASIIGKEAMDSSEKPLISAVFHNRMRLGMKLQSDPTALYGLDDDHVKVLPSHLKLDTPYNTYRIFGLPPGPIANPGLDSIKAALNPARVNYLYFVAKKDGTHHFSVDYNSHTKAIKTYRQKKDQPG